MQVESDLESARRLTERHYAVDDIRGAVSVAGTRLELFLKGVAFPNANARKNLNQLIDGLSDDGTSEETIQALHDLRYEYNRAKHEPAYEPTLLAVLDLLRRFTEAAREVVNLGLGITGRSARDESRRCSG